MKSFDPVTLVAREAIRFVGTVGDVVSGSFQIYLALADAFNSNEIRNASDLTNIVLKTCGGCQPAVARNTVEVAAGLRILMPLPQATSANKKFSLGDQGRVIRAMIRHDRWTPSLLPVLMLRPLFEAHGDYLLQAMTAIEAAGTREEELEIFTRLVRELAQTKVEELPMGRSGLSWDTYLAELKDRQAWVGLQDANPSGPRKATFAELQAQQRKRFESLKQKTTKPESRDGGESKTFQHQLARSKTWLEDLGLIERKPVTRLTFRGTQVLAYFRRHTHGQPVRIPPTAGLLRDAFRLDDQVIEEAWGALVDDKYWEQGLYPLERYGTYQPTHDEFVSAVHWAFDQVRVKQVSEAAIGPLRQVVFLSFLFSAHPIQPDQLDRLLWQLLEERGDLFGLGRNRQGRPAFIFRKKRV